MASYYSILQDTLIGHLLAPFRETKTRKAVSTPKFYYFDVGVSNFLAGREKIFSGTTEYGKALEHFIFTELKAFNSYHGHPFELYYWRSTSKFEVDFILRQKSGSLIGIEVKGTGRVDKSDLRGFVAFEEYFVLHKKIVVCLEKSYRQTEDNYFIFPFELFCKKLWAHEIFPEVGLQTSSK